MAVFGPASGPEIGLAAQAQAVAAAFALGQFDPAGQAADARLVRQSVQFTPVQQHVLLLGAFVLAYHQAVAAGAVLPGDGARRVADAIGAQLVRILALRVDPGQARVVAAVGQRRRVGLGARIDQQRLLRPGPRPGPCQAQRLGGGQAQATGFEPAAPVRGQGQGQFAMAIGADAGPAAGRAQLATQAAALAAVLGAQRHPQPQRRTGRHRFGRQCIDLQSRQLQVRGDQACQPGRAQQQGQQQGRVVVVVERAQHHRQHQQGVEQAEAGGQHIDAAAVHPHRQRFGRAWPLETFEPFAQPVPGGRRHQSTGTACSTALASAAPLPASASPLRRWPATAMNSACTSSGST